MAGQRQASSRLRRVNKSTMKSVYLKPGEDDLLLAVWNAAGRPTALFRNLLLQGVKRMVERGELPAQLANNPLVQRHLGSLGELAPAMPVQVVGLEAPRVPRPSAPPLQPATAPSASPAQSQTSPQKDSPPRRVGLDASLM